MIQNTRLTSCREDEGSMNWFDIRLEGHGRCSVEFCDPTTGEVGLALDCPLAALLDPLKDRRVQLSGNAGSCLLTLCEDFVVAEIRSKIHPIIKTFAYGILEYRQAVQKLQTASQSSLI